MAVDIRPKLLEEIKSLEGEVEAQQRAIKQGVTKGQPVEQPKLRLKELTGRIIILRKNLEKLDTQKQETA